ncbi:UDP-N-acetylmuramoyl-tripeptide--D-alanyl-D-alanine ligase [Candidatus Dojkabacteria bacterium]|nr:UDP-N-acetylmuramoyl-tripeptide--D-alanyl-D-alanine ligase [Candidatus Dojkabacteria bacterium]
MNLLVKELKTDFSSWIFQNIDLETTISQISTDTRTIKPGEFFIPIKGENFDGHNFIADAISKGAVGAMCKADHPIIQKLEKKTPLLIVPSIEEGLKGIANTLRKKIKAQIIGITGSTGKTTTRELLLSVLSQSHKVLGSTGGINTTWGNIRYLFDYTDEDFIVLEIAMDRMGEIKWQCEAMLPDIVTILNIGEVHAGPLGGVENVIKAKKEMADYSVTYQKPIVLNIDDEKISSFTDSVNTKVISVATQKSADYTGKEISLTESGTKFIIYTQNQTFPVTLKIFGEGYVYNALTVAAICRELKLSWEEIQAGLERFSGFENRFQIINPTPYITIVNDAYNANPQSMNMSIATFVELFGTKSGQKIAFLGQMSELGERAESTHKELGELVKTSRFDKIFYIGDYFEHFDVGKKLETIETAKSEYQKIIEAASKDNPVYILVKGSHSTGLYTLTTG